jgi:O-antigen/teichoic acid export membrane protein/glycosyltransferase involved in cell wall biosynthesis
VRILFYVEGLDIGGANQTTVTTAVAMKKRGHEVFFAAQDGPLRERLGAAGIPLVTLNTRVSHPSRKAARVLGEILDRERIEVACPNGWDCLADALLATVPRGIPVVPTFPSVYPEYHHPRVPSAIVFSGEYRDALIRDFGWSPGSLQMLVSRIDTDRFRPGADGAEQRSGWGLSEGNGVVFMGCRFDAMKIEGIDFLLDAVVPLSRRCPSARVVLAGDGAHAREVEARVEAINREIGSPTVILAGKVLAMEKAFAAADVVVGNGARSGMEALACGRPVVSVGPSGLGGVMSPETIEDFAYYNFDKGRVFDGTTRRDPEALADAIAALLSDPEHRRRLGEFGREFSLERLSVDGGARRLESLLEAQRPLATGQKLWQRWELARSVVSFLGFAARRKLRRIVLGSPGPSRAAFEPAKPSTSFVRNTTTTFLSGVFGLGIGVVQSAVTARVLLPQGKGALTAALLLPQLLITVAPLGINWAGTYHLGQKTFARDVIARSMLAAWMIVGGAGVLLCLLASHLFRGYLYDGVPRSAILFAACTVPFQIALLFLNGLYRGEMRIAEANLMDISRATLMCVFILTALLVFHLGVTGVVVAQLLAEGLVALIGFRRFGGIPPVPLFRWDVIRRLVSFGIQIYSFSILLYLNYRFDLFLVRSKLDLTQTGLYSTAVAMAEILWIVPSSLGAVLFPSVAAASGSERDTLTLAVCRTSFYLMLILCTGLAIGRNLALGLFFGPRFVAAGSALLALLPGILAMSLQQVLGSALSGRGRPLPVTLGAGVGFVANVALNFAWIPSYGIVGASLASSVSYTLVALMVMVAYLRITGASLRDAILLKREDVQRFTGAFLRMKHAVIG